MATFLSFQREKKTVVLTFSFASLVAPVVGRSECFLFPGCGSTLHGHVAGEKIHPFLCTHVFIPRSAVHHDARPSVSAR